MKPALELVALLVDVADKLAEDRTMQVSNEALRSWREDVAKSRMQLSEGSDFAVDYEASCLVDCITALAYARTDGDRGREQRALMYLNTFRTFLRKDVMDAARKQAACVRH
jgi:hypothetical protein